MHSQDITRPVRIIVIGIVMSLSLILSGSDAMAASREALWGIINNCLDISALDYCTACKFPRTESNCKEKVRCEAQLEIWSESSNYIAMKDRKMCGCTEEFVHGLALPRAQVTGVEDPKRPSGIWEFAWNVARKRISSENTIALVVNPAQHRSQDQLHVHMVRLKDNARKSFPNLSLARTDSLDRVWAIALEKAKELKLDDDYGVLVTTHTDGGFVVLVDQESPEYKFTEATCR
jgi:CDP-diacylglycerol pyrophosphatase